MAMAGMLFGSLAMAGAPLGLKGILTTLGTSLSFLPATSTQPVPVPVLIFLVTILFILKGRSSNTICNRT